MGAVCGRTPFNKDESLLASQDESSWFHLHSNIENGHNQYQHVSNPNHPSPLQLELPHPLSVRQQHHPLLHQPRPGHLPLLHLLLPSLGASTSWISESSQAAWTGALPAGPGLGQVPSHQPHGGHHWEYLRWQPECPLLPEDGGGKEER